MKTFFSTALLATLALDFACALPAKRQAPSPLTNLLNQGMLPASNDGSIATDNSLPWANTFTNNAQEPIVLVCWGSAGSWVNAKAPLVAIPMAPGAVQPLSWSQTPAFQQGGACTAGTSSSKMVNGQISETWLEATFNDYGTVDVSREVNMASPIGFSTATGSGCTTSNTQCTFLCDSGNSCLGNYALHNCVGPGSNPMGGCMIGDSPMKTSITS